MLKKIVTLSLFPLLLMSCGSTNVWSETKDKTTELEMKTILALWDSLTAGYNLDISDSYPSQLEKKLQENNYNYEVINAWVSGDTSKNLLDRIWLYQETPAEIYLLTIWWNDGLRRQSISDMKENIQKIIDEIYVQNADAKIILGGMKLPINYGLDYASDFKWAYEELADENNLEFYPHFLKDVQQKPDLNLSDRIHPNAEWYTIISDNLYEFLEENNIISK